MKNLKDKVIGIFAIGMFLLALTSFANGQVFIQAQGANPAAIQAAVDQFRTNIGGVNNGVGGAFTSGRREVNWDGVPDDFADPNFLPGDFFNSNSPRGLMLHAVNQTGQSAPTVNRLLVSADSSNPTATVPEFGSINAGYPAIFQPFSAERLFIAANTPAIEVTFFIPGTKVPATVTAFGAVFTDVDSPNTNTHMEFYGPGGEFLFSMSSLGPASGGLSFAGVFSQTTIRIARVLIRSGKDTLSAGNVDGTAGVDVVAMDDFIYGEPRAMQYHTGDFDGDGVTDSTVYRPASGTWFTLRSGDNTVTIENFGLNGDIPVDGDFDGDRRADLCIFRPSSGVWFFKRSSNGTTLGAQFGQTGDKPVVGDYDKDGLSDIAIWRPSNGNYFVLRSSTNFSTFFGYPFGQNGDIPVQGGAQ